MVSLGIKWGEVGIDPDTARIDSHLWQTLHEEKLKGKSLNQVIIQLREGFAGEKESVESGYT